MPLTPHQSVETRALTAYWQSRLTLYGKYMNVFLENGVYTSHTTLEGYLVVLYQVHMNVLLMF
jgi:hypothetical protein